MMYKTMILELLQQRPQMYDQLRMDRKLLATMELYAKELKSCHAAWKIFLSELRPGSEPDQLSSEALEMALSEMEARLSAESSRDDETHFLDAAILFARRRMSGA